MPEAAKNLNRMEFSSLKKCDSSATFKIP